MLTTAGNGPSAMILSYILHGHIPLYTSETTHHPDPLLHAKLEHARDLLDLNVDSLTDHFAASRLSYSTQALPVNVLLDTLVCPSIDVEEGECVSNLRWRYAPEMAVPHLVFGDAAAPGGQWTEADEDEDEDEGEAALRSSDERIQTLSYASMLSLPGYCYATHYQAVTGKVLPAFNRPTRREFAGYLRAYPRAVRIDDVFRNGQSVDGISRTEDGFYIASHGIRCKHLVLASGIFSEPIRPPPMVEPLLSLRSPTTTPDPPLLIIGSGFSAADAIVSAPKEQKIIHLYKWDPESKPSPLRGCHQQAYPEYAGVYRLMKRAAESQQQQQQRPTKRTKNRRIASTPFLDSRNWDRVYEGFPNAEVVAVDVNDTATVTFRLMDGTITTRPVAGLAHAVGRRGSLRYLDDSLLAEVLSPRPHPGSGSSPANDAEKPNGIADNLNPTISGQTLRNKALDDLEVARDVFIIGSLTGDSLIRFAYGGCVYTAGKLIRAYTGVDGVDGGCSSSAGARLVLGEAVSSSSKKPMASSLSVMNGIEGHRHPVFKGGGGGHGHEENYSVLSAVLPSWWRSLMEMWRWD